MRIILKVSIDVSAAYPVGEVVLNASGHTTVAEISSIKDVDEELVRAAGLHLMSGPVNSIETVTSIYKAPQIEDFFNDYMEHEL